MPSIHKFKFNFFDKQLCKDCGIVDSTLYEEKTRHHLLLTGLASGRSTTIEGALVNINP